jgi:hypothetical protein
MNRAVEGRSRQQVAALRYGAGRIVQNAGRVVQNSNNRSRWHVSITRATSGESLQNWRMERGKFNFHKCSYRSPDNGPAILHGLATVATSETPKLFFPHS